MRPVSETKDSSFAPSIPAGPPPLAPFGLVLHHDGSFTHEGEPILNRKLREHFDRSVEYLPDERKYIVRLGHFRGQVEIEEAAFFVRSVFLETGEIALSDRTREPLDVSSLTESPIDGAFLCRVKCDLVPGGVIARFMHGPQAELLQSVVDEDGSFFVRIADELRPFVV